jgi:small subunit ribosomal protein S2
MNMAVPNFSMRELIDAGVHFGHKTKRWNPRMAPFIYGARNDVHIIDLQKTVPMLHRALTAVRKVSANNGRVLFVGTKRQASEAVAEAAKRSGQYYVNSRWLGGMLTNWKTIQNSIRQLKNIEETLESGDSGLTKKELLQMERQREKLERSLGGIRDMGGLPDLMFVIDTNREDLAVKEAQKLGIPIVAIVDTNCSVDGIDFPIPGNDDATRAIKLYCKLLSDAVLDGLQEGIGASDVDLGAQAEPEALANQAVQEAPKEEAAAAEKETKKSAAKKKVASSTKKEAFAKEAEKAASKKKPAAKKEAEKEDESAPEEAA